jgi:uncharacterized membrane protein
MRTRNLRSAIYLAAGLGLIVAIFSAAEFFDAALLAVCSVNSYVSCGAVAHSGLTNTLGIPDYLWGIGGFVLILVLAALAEQRPSDRRRALLLLGITTLGVAFSLYFLYVEVVQIHALCPVCVADYLLGGVAWIGAIALARRSPEAPKGDGDDDDDPDGADGDT